MIPMAPAASLPDVDMSLTQQVDILQSYWLLFDKIKNDFVGKDDLDVMLKTATVNGGSQLGNSGGPVPVIAARIAFTVTDNLARQKALLYSKQAQTGSAVRGKTVEGLEALTS